MGWVTKRGPRRCRFVLPERSRFSQIGHIIFRTLVALKTSVPLTCRFVACSSRIKVDRQTDTHTHTHTHTRTHTHTHTHTHTQTHTDGQTKYRNPRACAPRVNKHTLTSPLLVDVYISGTSLAGQTLSEEERVW